MMLAPLVFSSLKRVLMGLLLTLLAGGSAASLSAQESSLTAEELQLLRRRVADREADLKAENERLATEEVEARRAISRLEVEREETAEALVEALEREESLNDELRELESKLAGFASNEGVQNAGLVALAQALADNADQLRLALRESPMENGGPAIDELKDMAAEARAIAKEIEADALLSEASASNIGERLASVGLALFDHSDRAADEARQILRRRGKIRDASGVERDVELMALGRVAYAYRDGERYGLALASPEDARGMRWSEALPEEVRDQLGALFRGDEAAAWPLDVNGVLAPETLAGDRGWRRAMTAGGWIMWPLAGLALIAIFLGAERLIVLFPGSRQGSAGDLASRVRDAVEEHAESGRAVAEEAAEIVLLAQLPRLERFLGTLATIASVAPLLGLLGTVTGIIRSFGVIRAFGAADPAQLSGGISEALFTTAFGLAVAIPVLILHGFLQGRVDRLVAAAQHEAARALEGVQPS